MAGACNDNLQFAEIWSVVALARDKGWIGQALRTLPDWMLREADGWAEYQAAYQEKHEIPNRLPLPDSWRFLLDVPAISRQLKRVCRAAQSQLWAWRRIGRMRMGFATLNTDFHETAMKAKADSNEGEYRRLIAKFASQVVLYAPVQEDMRAQVDDPEIMRQMECSIARRRAQLIHRGQGDQAGKPKPWPRWNEFASRNKLSFVLVEMWVRFPERLILRPPVANRPGLSLEQGTPGLMFFRNEALFKFLKFALQQDNLTPAAVKKVRQRLRLNPVEDSEHLIWDVHITRRSSGDWDMKLLTRKDV